MAKKPRKPTAVEKKLVGVADLVITAAEKRKDPTIAIPVRSLSHVEFNEPKGLTRLGKGGYSVPSIVEPEYLQIARCTADFVLLVEKGTQWNRLSEDKFWRRYNCVLLTGNGQPPRGVRRLARRLHEEKQLPVYVLVDNDPWGYYIYSVIKQGSINLAFESQRMAIPKAKFMGLSSADPEAYGLPRNVGIKLHSMDVRFWGTRGSVAKPGPTTLRYGGNTSCVEVRGVDGTLIVLDCGTGAHGLGQALVSAGGPRCDGHLMITHTHWDHIQGFPFFAPLFIPGNTWDIYAPGALGQQLERTLAGQMEYNYFPVTLAQLGASIRFHDLAEGRFTVGAVRITTQYLNHPALALGYRLQSGGRLPSGRPAAGPPGPRAARCRAAPRPRAKRSGSSSTTPRCQARPARRSARRAWGRTPSSSPTTTRRSSGC